MPKTRPSSSATTGAPPCRHRPRTRGCCAAPFAWLGRRGNVFCVDYSVGARAQARTFGRPHAHMKLAALRWPERSLVFDDGSTHATTGFMRPALAVAA